MASVPQGCPKDIRWAIVDQRLRRNSLMSTREIR
jgi:hypothetical protein